VEYVLDATLPAELTANAPEDERNVYATKKDENTLLKCLMLTCMDPELHKRFERFNAFEMVREMDALYKKEARDECFEITNTLIECQMDEGALVIEHMVKIASYADRLNALEFPILEMLRAYCPCFTPPILRQLYHESQH
jgi:hypothetical protein